MTTYDDTVQGWISQFRARLVDDSDTVADVDLIYGMYCALTGEEIPHPYDLEEEEIPPPRHHSYSLLDRKAADREERARLLRERSEDPS